MKDLPLTAVISHTPIYVWVLLAYLVWNGLQARKTRVVSWKTVLILPSALFTWSLYAILTNYGLISICLWALSVALGIWLGAWTTRNLPLRFDKNQKRIEIPGSWMTMILSVALFSSRYFLGAAHGLYPELSGSPALFALENLATLVSGMFAGRLIGYWRRAKASPHVDIAPAG